MSTSIYKPQLTFQKVGKTDLYTADDGTGRSRVTVIRQGGNAGTGVYRVADANIILVGDGRTITALHQLMTETGYPSLSEIWPGGMSSSTYTKLRRWLDITERGEHGARAH